eukprot:10914866-Alexandrium_andersonii.AAC.1
MEALFKKTQQPTSHSLLHEWKWFYATMRGEDCEAMMRASCGQKIKLATFGGIVRAAELAASLTMCV